MIGTVSNDIDEDEDVIIQGSDLHEALCKMGYTEFECVSKTVPSEPLGNSIVEETSSSVQTIRHCLMNIYRYLTQVKDFSEEQLKIILQAEPLLDDHASYIRSFIHENQPTFWRKILGKIPLISSAITAMMSIILVKQNRILTLMFVLPVVTIIANYKYLRWCASKDLRNLVSLQKELYRICKRGLRILHYGYGIKRGSDESKLKFSNLGTDRLKRLQLVTEVMVNSVEDMSHIYYQTSLIIAEFLPKSYQTKHLITEFDSGTFTVNGEVTYETLKCMYYTYILTQSDMLQLLAIAYNSDTWLEYGTIPETKLANVIYKLLRVLKKYKSEMSRAIDNYHACEIVPVHHEYRGSPRSKWQDIYGHLNLTSYKIQVAYSHLESIIKDIGTYADTNTNDTEFDEVILQKMNDVCKQIDTARNFAEFGSLLLIKIQNSSHKKASSDTSANLFTSIIESKLPVIQDSDPEIIDEVFEEYIKEEYLRPLYEDSNDMIQQNYKLDKLLVKNFMSELKEVLIDKYKSMSERESKALQRMYKNVPEKCSSENEENLDCNDSNTDVNVKTKSVTLAPSFETKFAATDCKPTTKQTLIPHPPPLPPFNIVDPINNYDSASNWKEESISCTQMPSNQEPRNDDSEVQQNILSSGSTDVLNNYQDKSAVPCLSPPLPFINKETEGTLRSPISSSVFNEQLRSFFNITEETYTGSGENSEDEPVNSEPEEEMVCD